MIRVFEGLFLQSEKVRRFGSRGSFRCFYIRKLELLHNCPPSRKLLASGRHFIFEVDKGTNQRIVA